MKRVKVNGVKTGALAALFLLAGCVIPPRGGTAPRPKHVVAMIFDGLAGYTVSPETMPTVWGLMQRGSWTLRSRSILPSSSSLNWHSLFTCSASEQHGYTDWNTRKPKFAPVAVCENGLYPDIFYLLRRQRPEAASHLVCEWDGILFDVDTNACTIARQKAKIDAETDVCEVLRKNPPAFLAACYDQPDHPGHDKGWNGPAYYETLRFLDNEVAKVVKTLEETGLAGDTVLVITSDHGGHGRGHGGPTLEEMERPFVVAGPGIRRNHRIELTGAIYDDGATIAALLGIEPHPAWIGRPRLEIFE